MPTGFDSTEVFGFTPPPIEPLVLTKVSDLLAEPPEKHRWVVDGILGIGSTSLLCSSPKVGKTTLLYGLSKAIVRGEAWIGKTTLKSCVVVLFLEDRRDEIRYRYKALNILPSDDLHLFCGRSPWNPMRWLRRIIETYRPGIIIADTWLRLFGSSVRDLNDYGDTTRLFDDVIQLVRGSGCHCLFTHHFNKKGFGTAAILGSTGLFASVDTAILLQRYGQRRTIQSIQRYGSDMIEQEIILNPETMVVQLGAGANNQSKTIAIEIRSVLASRGNLTEPEIVSDTCGSTTYKRAVLRELVRAGEIIRTGSGTRGSPFRYALSQSRPSAPL